MTAAICAALIFFFGMVAGVGLLIFVWACVPEKENHNAKTD